MSNRKEYLKQAKLKLDKLDAQIDSLEAEVAKKKIDANATWHSKLAELRKKRDKSKDKLQSAHEASDDAWQSIQDGLDKVLDDMEDTYEKTKVALTH